MVRLTAAGAPDAGFGKDGTVSFGAFAPQVLPTTDGGLVVAAVTPYERRGASQPALRIERIMPDGEHGSTASVDPGVGGGFVSAHQITRIGPGLDQDAFVPGSLVQRPDGSLVLAGGVRIVRYGSDGRGFSTGLFAGLALTPALGLDRTFGGSPAPASFQVRVPAQRAATDARRRRILVRVTASGPGLALLRMRDDRRRVLAQSLHPVFAAGKGSAVQVALTTLGSRVLGQGRSVRVSVGHAFRDVLTSTAHGARIARLR
jgi:hypothetical protein